MKYIITLCITLTTSLFIHATTSELHGLEASRLYPGASHILLKGETNLPDLIELSPSANVTPEGFFATLVSTYHLPSSYGYRVIRTERDQLGYEHQRCQLLINGVIVTDAIFLIHSKEGKVTMYNGYIPKTINTATTPSLSEPLALQAAIKAVGATQYKWQIAGENEALKRTTHNSTATYYPTGELCIIQKHVEIGSSAFALAWRFDIYAQQPTSRQYVYIDAVSGAIVRADNRIETANTPATATTVYRGNRAIQTDSYNGSYRLQETTRGNGINTFNLQKTTNYSSAIDFTNATTTWNNVNANQDQYATDAHWGGEMTYDFYMNTFGRNGIDGNGFALNLYVHYDNALANANWDGQEMNFGDGAGGNSSKPFTCLEVTGHEISHGLTQYTANLNYQNESGAMNEAFSDIMGTAVEFYGDSTRANWTVGEDIGPAFRSLANPKYFRQPNTYQGVFWATGVADNGGVHTNSGVMNYWYYLLCKGGRGTNDSGFAYNLSAIGRAKATAIVWRMQTVYLIASSQYYDARTYSIQAAIDLYGACSVEAIAVDNAWHAVGVGPGATGLPTVAFNLPSSSCSLPFRASFSNRSRDAFGYLWSFGDGDTSSLANPTHTYTTPGTFTVNLIATGCLGSDSNNSTISITPPNSPTVTRDACVNNTQQLHASGGSVHWYSSATDTAVLSSNNTYTTPALSGTSTYYVSEIVATPKVKLGAADNTISTGSYLNNANRALRFMVNQSSRLLSVYMYSQSGGTVSVVYRDTLGTILASRSVNLAIGGGRVQLNIDLIPSATRVYELGVSAGTTNQLYRNDAGAIYPYTDGNGLVSIIGNNIPSGTPTGNPSPGYYYYFYDWEVLAPACESARTAVTASCTTGIEDAITGSIASCYPNPATSTLHIKLSNTSIISPTTIRVVDMLGRVIASREIKVAKDTDTAIDVVEWAAGAYLVEIQMGSQFITKRIMIDRN